MAISYIICAAGRGTRTLEISKSVPKALLQINGFSLLELAVSSLPLTSQDELIIIGQREDQLSRLEPHFKKVCKLVWLELDEVTSGQLHTAFLGLEHVSRENSIAIFNADSWFECPTLLEEMQDTWWEGIIPCAVEAGDAWSFCEVAEDKKNVIRVAEKQRISKWCSVGFYFFRNQKLFRELAQEELSQKSNTEFYVSNLYGRYLELKKPILMLRAEKFKAMGSVDQLSTYWNIGIEEMQKQNKNSPWRRA